MTFPSIHEVITARTTKGNGCWYAWDGRFRFSRPERDNYARNMQAGVHTYEALGVAKRYTYVPPPWPYSCKDPYAPFIWHHGTTASFLREVIRLRKAADDRQAGMWRATAKASDIPAKEQEYFAFAEPAYQTPVLDMNSAAKTEYHMGDAIELTGNIVDGFEEFIWTEGHREGTRGLRATKADKATAVTRAQSGWADMQDGFRTLRELETANNDH